MCFIRDSVNSPVYDVGIGKLIFTVSYSLQTSVDIIYESFPFILTSEVDVVNPLAE